MTLTTYLSQLAKRSRSSIDPLAVKSIALGCLNVTEASLLSLVVYSPLTSRIWAPFKSMASFPSAPCVFLVPSVWIARLCRAMKGVDRLASTFMEVSYQLSWVRTATSDLICWLMIKEKTFHELYEARNWYIHK